MGTVTAWLQPPPLVLCMHPALAEAPLQRLQPPPPQHLTRSSSSPSLLRPQPPPPLCEHDRAACVADSPACVSLLLRTTSAITRSQDCVLHALPIAAGAGSERALGALLASPELLEHMRWWVAARGGPHGGTCPLAPPSMWTCAARKPARALHMAARRHSFGQMRPHCSAAPA